MNATYYGFPPEVREVVRARAERHATLVGERLQAHTSAAQSLADMPRAFYLELGAVLQIAEWEEQGVLAHLGGQLPSKAEAITQLVARIGKGPATFMGPDAAPLSRQVLRACVERLAWDGPEYFGTDVPISPGDEEEGILRLAEFLWKHRADSSGLLDGGAMISGRQRA